MTTTRLFATAALLIVSVGSARASTFTESVQFGTAPTDFNKINGTTAGPTGNQLYYFDTNGGTLNSITFSYSYAVSSQITVINTSTSASFGSAATQSAAQFSSDSTTITAALNSVVNGYQDSIDGHSVTFGSTSLSPIAADVRGTRSTYTLSPGTATSLFSAGSYSPAAYTVTNASVLAAFSKAGGGTFTPLFSTLTGLVISNSGGNTTASQVTTAQGNLSISFDYAAATSTTSVPEPTSMALLGVGLVGLAMRRPRRG